MEGETGMRPSIRGIVLLVCVGLLGVVACRGDRRGAVNAPATNPEEAGTCTYGGQVYEVGEAFPALDGCNSCYCMAAEEIVCTLIACPCDPEREPHRRYVSTDPEVCARIRFTCEAGWQPFFNDCGCGCEMQPGAAP
jgi:hypothetical protein